jgi:hypothetical protein
MSIVDMCVGSRWDRLRRSHVAGMTHVLIYLVRLPGSGVAGLAA